MGGGNGAKAQQKRERNAAKNAKKGGASQLKQNTAAMNIQCEVCKATFLKTIRVSELTTHQQNKHDKRSFAECFPTYTAA